MSEARLLDGKVALVTGATRGIGLGIARALAKQRCAIVLHGLGEPDEIQRHVADLSDANGVEVHHHGADLRDVGQIESLCRDAMERFGRIDVLVNNAGVQHTSPIESFPVGEWDRLLSVNLSAAFHTTRLLLPQMRSAGWGRVINIASTHGLVASIHKAAYIASKHGLVGLTKVVALETASSNITCNAICPGWTRTVLVERQIEARAREQGVSIEEAASGLLQEKQPSGTFVTPEQIGALALFLCSDSASQITGATLPIDGGWTAQ